MPRTNASKQLIQEGAFGMSPISTAAPEGEQNNRKTSRVNAGKNNRWGSDSESDATYLGTKAAPPPSSESSEVSSSSDDDDDDDVDDDDDNSGGGGGRSRQKRKAQPGGRRLRLRRNVNVVEGDWDHRSRVMTRRVVY